MKKTLFIIAAVISFSVVSYASPTVMSISNKVVVKPSNLINPFCMSIIKGDYDMVKKLVDLGENVNLKSNGMTPAMYAAKYNRVDILKYLVKNGANLRIKSSKGKTAEYYAKLSNAKEALEFIQNHLKGKKKKRK